MTDHCQLQKRAAQIADDQLRRWFLENVPAHREIVHEFARSKVVSTSSARH